MHQDPVIYIVVVVYCLLMLGLGLGASRLNQSGDDLRRGCASGTWRIADISFFMRNLCASIFSSATSAVFDAGWSVMWINADRFICLCLGGTRLPIGAIPFTLGQRANLRLKAE